MSGFFISSAVADNISWSLAIGAGCIGTRIVIEWLATRWADPVEARRRRFTIRAFTNIILAVALLGIWLAEIQNLVFSLTAVLVAMVIATKELITCVAGSVLRFGGHLFKVGDRIEMNGIHGEVVDHGLFSTTIMELPHRELGSASTGRTVMLPNSVLLTGSVRVEAQPRQYTPYRFTLTMESAVSARETVRILHEAAETALEEDRDLAARFHQFAARKSGAEIDGPQTTVSLHTTDLGKMQFHVTIYCLVKDAARLQQAITLELFDRLEAREKPAKPVETKVWSEIARQLKEAANTQHRAA